MQRRAIAGLLGGLFLLTLGSCRDKLTEMLVVVSNEGLVVGDEIDAVDLTLRDPAGVVTHQQRVPLCLPGAPPTTAKCLYFPFSALLVPGEEKPSQPVEVQIDALKGGQKVLANVAIFRFTKQKKLRLDVILYPECFGNVSCAEQKKACIKNGQCADLQPSELDPTTLPMQPDLAGETARDLAVASVDLAMSPGDLAMSMPPDLAMPPPMDDLAMALPGDLASPDLLASRDLLPPADLSPPADLTGCVPNCSGRMCGNDGCNGSCPPGCGTGFQCSGTGACKTCGVEGAICCMAPQLDCQPGLACFAGTCEAVDLGGPPCGGSAQMCCSGQCLTGFVCSLNFCVPGSDDMMLGSGAQDMSLGLPDAGGGASFGAGIELWGPF